MSICCREADAGTAPAPGEGQEARALTDFETFRYKFRMYDGTGEASDISVAVPKP